MAGPRLNSACATLGSAGHYEKISTTISVALFSVTRNAAVLGRLVPGRDELEGCPGQKSRFLHFNRCVLLA